MVRVCLQLCSDNQETATRSASATLHRAHPTAALCHGAGAGHPAEGYGQPAAGPRSGLWGCISQGLMTGWAPQKHPSYAGQAGSRHPGSRCSPSHPPCHAASCLRRNAPGSDTRLPPDRQAAAGCSNPAELGPVLPASSAGEGVTGRSHRAGTLLPHH